ncbi:hypothetical protein CV944_07960 [Geobacillus sp. WSUCF-018B]|nr:hypothetical protein CV944_07960 [Geobacillus sp. WSUCF-018B]
MYPRLFFGYPTTMEAKVFRRKMKKRIPIIVRNPFVYIVNISSKFGDSLVELFKKMYIISCISFPSLFKE